MNGPAPEDILQFIAARHGRSLSPAEAADVLAALDLDGAAADAFMADYARAFGVDLTGYEPAFHHRSAPEAARLGWPLPVVPRFGLRFPLPVSVLALAAQRGIWPLRYPMRTPRPSRDGWNWPLVLLALPLLAALLIGLIRVF